MCDVTLIAEQLHPELFEDLCSYPSEPVFCKVHTHTHTHTHQVYTHMPTQMCVQLSLYITTTAIISSLMNAHNYRQTLSLLLFMVSANLQPCVC